MIRKFFAYFFSFGLLIGLAACSDYTPAPATAKGEVLLKLNISYGINNAPDSRSRAEGDDPQGDEDEEPTHNNDGRPDGYEPGDGEAEKIRTMRVIVLRNDVIDGVKVRTVEAARVVRTSDVGVPLYDNLEFPVLADDDKTIVLIANESSIPYAPNHSQTPSEWLDRWFSAQRDAQGRDKTVDDAHWNALMNWTVSMSAAQPSFFTVLGEDGNYYQNPIPLTETFDIHTIPSDLKVEEGEEQDARIVQTSNLFITRVAAKVTYKFYYNDDNIGEAAETDEVYVTGVRLEGLQPTEYVFLKNGRYYRPKYVDGDVSLGVDQQNWNSKRITGFEPYPRDQYFNLETMFSGNNVIPIKKYEENETPVVGPIYFPESMVPKRSDYFRVSVQINNGEWLASQPLETNILNSALETGGCDAISRNTHLYINIYFGSPGIRVEVDVVPYIGVNLNPSFGF